MPESQEEDGGFAEMAFYIRSFQISKMLEVVAVLGVADMLGDGVRPVAELATECRADPAALRRLLRALGAFGIFAVGSDDTVGHTPRSRWLRSDAKPTLRYAARYWGMPSTWKTWGYLEHAVRTGEAPFETFFGLSYFEHLQANDAEAQIFDSFMQNSPDDRHAAVVEAYDFSGPQLIVDVGGGNGAMLAAILTAYPEPEGILFDRENVVSSAKEVLGKEAGRCRIESGDFLERVPAGGDVYTLSQILHDWNDERCLRILANCRDAMGPGKRLLVIERLLDAERSTPLNFLSDMHMMMLFPGAKERTPEEYSALLQQSGFGPSRIIATRSPHCIIEAHALG